MNKYKLYNQDQLDNHFSQFLINSWSYSKVTTFSRNQKVFEMEYIYGYKPKYSPTTIAGNAYHNALELYFGALKNKEEIIPDMVVLTNCAYDYISAIEANKWKLQKTNPTIQDCISSACSTVKSLIGNFLKEISIYLDEVDEILDVEFFGNEFITLNGVDIPLPLNFRCDLVVRLKNGKVVIIDHKSKSKFSDEQSVNLIFGKQAITYSLGYEEATDIKVNEVWFVENKYAQNRDKLPQLVKYILDVSNAEYKRYYEHLLYENVRATISAVNDPDYVYLVNDNDNLTDLAEIYAFWTKTLLSEVEDLNIDESKKELIQRRLKKIKDSSINTINPNVLKEVKKNASKFIQYDYSNKDMTNEEKIEHSLRNFGISVNVAHKFNGYSCNTYLLEVGVSTKTNAIHSHKLDLANALDVNNVRLSKDLVVYNNKSYVALEVSKKRDKDLLFDTKDISGFKIPIGKDNLDNVLSWNLENHSTPHTLVCGATGSGKSVFLYSTICFAQEAGIKDIIILDPKYEFIRMGLKGVTIINDILEIEQKMKALVEEMNHRVTSGNSSLKLIVFDEFADAQAQARSGKELDIYEEKRVGYYRQSAQAMALGLPPQEKFKVEKVGTEKSLEENLKILLQKGRSVGFRIMAATQRASAKIINGDAKANFPTLICFRVPKAIDSQVVIDEPGAECLAGYGDGLIKSPEYIDITRFQAYYKE